MCSDSHPQPGCWRLIVIFAGPHTVQTLVLYHSFVLYCQKHYTANLPAYLACMSVNLHLCGCKFSQYLRNCSVAHAGRWCKKCQPFWVQIEPGGEQTEAEKNLAMHISLQVDNTGLISSSWMHLRSILANKPTGTSVWTFSLMKCPPKG